MELGLRLQREIERLDQATEGVVPLCGRGDPHDRFVVVQRRDPVVSDRVDLAANDRLRVFEQGRLVVAQGGEVAGPDRGDNVVLDPDAAGDVDVLMPLVAVPCLAGDRRGSRARARGPRARCRSTALRETIGAPRAPRVVADRPIDV